MSVARRIGRRVRRLAATTVQVAPAATVLVVLSNDFDSFAFLVMLGIFTALATLLAALLSIYERHAGRRPSSGHPSSAHATRYRLRVFT